MSLRESLSSFKTRVLKMANFTPIGKHPPSIKALAVGLQSRLVESLSANGIAGQRVKFSQMIDWIRGLMVGYSDPFSRWMSSEVKQSSVAQAILLHWSRELNVMARKRMRTILSKLVLVSKGMHDTVMEIRDRKDGCADNSSLVLKMLMGGG